LDLSKCAGWSKTKYEKNHFDEVQITFQYIFDATLTVYIYESFAGDEEFGNGGTSVATLQEIDRSASEVDQAINLGYYRRVKKLRSSCVELDMGDTKQSFNWVCWEIVWASGKKDLSWVLITGKRFGAAKFYIKLRLSFSPDHENVVDKAFPLFLKSLTWKPKL